MKRFQLLSAAFACSASLCAGVSTAHAQGIEKFDDPSAKSSTTGSQSRLVLEAGDADAKGTARIAKTSLHPGKTDPATKTTSPDRFTRFAFTLSAPFDSKKAAKVDVGSLSGLTAGTTATLDFGYMVWPRPSRSMSDLCQRLVPKFVPGHDWTNSLGKTGLGCDRHLFTRAKIDKVIDAFNAKLAACRRCQPSSAPGASRCALLADSGPRVCSGTAADTPACVLVASERKEACADCEKIKAECGVLAGMTDATLKEELFKEVVDNHENEIRSADRKAFPGETWINATVKANRQNFTYVLASAPTAVLKSQEEGFATSLGVTYLQDLSLYAFGYSHEESYQGGDKAQICSPIGSTGSTRCREAILGAPARQKAELAFLEHRRLFLGRKYAIAPRIEYDFKASKFAAQLPFYFLPNKEGTQLTGGIALGYSEGAEDEVGVTIFISKAFSLIE